MEPPNRATGNAHSEPLRARRLAAPERLAYSREMKLLYLALLASTALAADPGNKLDGKWVQSAVDCDGGTPSSTVQLNQSMLKKDPKPRLEIHGSSATFSTPNGISNEGYCEIVASETWEITERTYKLLNIHIRQQEHGRKCSSENKVVPGSGEAHRYTLKDDTLKLYLDFPRKKDPEKTRGHGLCPGGTLVQTYQREK